MARQPQELIEFLQFWKQYPYNLARCRAAIASILRSKGPVWLLCRRDRQNRFCDIPPENVAAIRYNTEQSCVCGAISGGWVRDWSGGDPQCVQIDTTGLSITRDEIRYSQALIGYSCGEQPLIPCFTPAKATVSSDKSLLLRIEISEYVTRDLHDQITKILCAEAERRGMDSSVIALSAKLCRDHCGRTNIFTSPPTWPEVAALSGNDRAVVLEADRVVNRLFTQLELERDQEATVKSKVVAFGPEERTILELLQREHPMTVVQSDFGVGAPNTAIKYAKLLKDKGLIYQPNGPRKGYTLTQAGLKLFPPKSSE